MSSSSLSSVSVPAANDFTVDSDYVSREMAGMHVHSPVVRRAHTPVVEAALRTQVVRPASAMPGGMCRASPATPFASGNTGTRVGGEPHNAARAMLIPDPAALSPTHGYNLRPRVVTPVSAAPNSVYTNPI